MEKYSAVFTANAKINILWIFFHSIDKPPSWTAPLKNIDFSLIEANIETSQNCTFSQILDHCGVCL